MGPAQFCFEVSSVLGHGGGAATLLRPNLLYSLEGFLRKLP